MADIAVYTIRHEPTQPNHQFMMKTISHRIKTVIFAYLLLSAQSYAESHDAVITILNTGYVAPIEDRNFVPGQRDDGARRVASTVALVMVENAVIIVDPGMVADDIDLIANLEKAGVKSTEVTHVFISHHHPDHTVKIGLFPNATVVDFWGSYHHDLWEDHGDDFQIADNVHVIRTPGHTDEDASLIIDTNKGTYVFTHVWWNENMQPEVDPLAEDNTKLIESREKVLAIADFIIPGHGRMFANPRNKDIQASDN